MDPLTEERTPGQEGVATVPIAPSNLGVDWGPSAAASGRARAINVGLVVLALLASLAAWQGFVHSPWGARLRALNEIVFEGGQNSNGSGGFLPQLYVAQPDGSGFRQLAHLADGFYFSPVWSPDGAHIAAFIVANNLDSVAHLVVMDSDGSNARVISAVALSLNSFSQSAGFTLLPTSRLIDWSPDGSRIVAPNASGQYVLVNSDGTQPHLFNGILPTWSPDGRTLAYYTRIEDQSQFSTGLVYTIELLDTQTFQTRDLNHLPDLNADALAWSPDGHALAVSAFQGGSVRSLPVDSVMLVYPDGRSAEMVGQWVDGLVEQIAWSPDSKKLAVVYAPPADAGEGTIQVSSGSDLWVVNIDGSNAHQIGTNDGGLPSWSPDGKHLVYASPDNGALEIADVNAWPVAPARSLAFLLNFLVSPCWSPLGGFNS